MMQDPTTLRRECLRDGFPDDQPRTFGSAAEAIRWADAFLLDPHMRSQVEKIRRRNVEQPTKGGPRLDELADMAHSISIEMSRLPWTAGPLFRFVHGQKKHGLELSDRLAHHAWNGPGVGSMAKRKTIAQCRDLARVMLLDAREREQFGRKPMSQARMADRIGMTREQLRDQWLEERSAIIQEISRLLTKADADLDGRLRRIGVVV